MFGYFLAGGRSGFNILGTASHNTKPKAILHLRNSVAVFFWLVEKIFKTATVHFFKIMLFLELFLQHL